MDNTEHIEQIKDALGYRGRYDAAIKIVLCKIVQNATPSDTIKSRRHSLLAPIKKELDPAMSDWLLRNGYDSTWTFSELLNAPIPDAISVLQDFARQGHDDDWFCGNDFSRTCDALIEFLHFCGEHPSHHIAVAKFEPQKRVSNNEFMPTIGRGRALGTRATENKTPVPLYLSGVYKSLKNQNLCTACGLPTLAAEERDRLLVLESESKVKNILKAGGQYSSKYRASLEYCYDHSEKLSRNSAARHGRRWRKSFLSLLFVMKRKGVNVRLNALFDPSYELEFARSAILDKKCHGQIRKIVKATPDLISDNLIQQQLAAVSIVNTLTQILQNLGKRAAPYDPSTHINAITLGVQNGVTLLNANAFGIFPWYITSPHIAPPMRIE